LPPPPPTPVPVTMPRKGVQILNGGTGEYLGCVLILALALALAL
jgi:hypothetical protein